MGRSGTTSVAAAIVLVLAGAQAEAKPAPPKDAIQICARIENPTHRLACFDELAKSSASDLGVAAATGSAKAAPSGPAPAAAPVIATAPAAAAAPISGVSRQADSVGRRKLEERNEPARTAYAAVVTRAWASATGDYYVALTNGEVWRSEAHEKVRPVKEHEEVELTPGALGGWFMEFKTLKRPPIRVSLTR